MTPINIWTVFLKQKAEVSTKFGSQKLRSGEGEKRNFKRLVGGVLYLLSGELVVVRLLEKVLVEKLRKITRFAIIYSVSYIVLNILWKIKTQTFKLYFDITIVICLQEHGIDEGVSDPTKGQINW